jgi:hypothetical protein
MEIIQFCVLEILFFFKNKFELKKKINSKNWQFKIKNDQSKIFMKIFLSKIILGILLSMNYLKTIFNYIKPSPPEYDPLEVSINEIILIKNVILFPIFSENSGRAHIWFLDDDIIYPNASFTVKDKKLINYQISIKQLFVVHMLRFMNNFSIIEIE